MDENDVLGGESGWAQIRSKMAKGILARVRRTITKTSGGDGWLPAWPGSFILKNRLKLQEIEHRKEDQNSLYWKKEGWRWSKRTGIKQKETAKDIVRDETVTLVQNNCGVSRSYGGLNEKTAGCRERMDLKGGAVASLQMGKSQGWKTDRLNYGIRGERDEKIKEG